MESELVFEKIGDITTPYPYLYVYLADGTEPHLASGAFFFAEMQPFMAIFVTESKRLEFAIFPNTKELKLNPEQWREIFQQAELFLPTVLADAEYE